MYFPVGWPKHLELQDCKAFPISVFCNRDRSLFGILTEDSVSVWFIRVSFFYSKTKQYFMLLIRISFKQFG